MHYSQKLLTEYVVFILCFGHVAFHMLSTLEILPGNLRCIAKYELSIIWCAMRAPLRLCACRKSKRHRYECKWQNSILTWNVVMCVSGSLAHFGTMCARCGQICTFCEWYLERHTHTSEIAIDVSESAIQWPDNASNVYICVYGFFMCSCGQLEILAITPSFGRRQFISFCVRFYLAVVYTLVKWCRAVARKI